MRMKTLVIGCLAGLGLSAAAGAALGVGKLAQALSEAVEGRF